MGKLLEQLSSLSTPLIIGAFAAHLLLFLVLWIWSRRDLMAIASALFDFTKGIRNQSRLDSTGHLADQIDAFLADVNDVLDDPGRKSERAGLLERMRILDEKRRYLDTMFFDTVYNMCRSMIETYPLAGVLGTIVAIGAALQSNPAATDAAATLGMVLGRFGEAISSTAAGLIAAITLIFINSCVETPFARLSENRRHVRETIARAKRELSFSQAADGTQP